MQRSAAGAVRTIRKQELFLGTRIEYAHFIQEGTKNMPARKIVFISGGDKEVSRADKVSGRLEAWLEMLNDHALQLIELKGYK